MWVTITSLRLRSIWGFFKLSWFGLKISTQAKGEKGFVGIKNTGFGFMHYTLTQWQTEADLKRFAQSGAHREAMKSSAALATEIKIYSYQSDTLPGWAAAKSLLAEKGRSVKF